MHSRAVTIDGVGPLGYHGHTFESPGPGPADAVGDGGPDETWVDRECPFDDDQDAPPLPGDVEFVEP